MISDMDKDRLIQTLTAKAEREKIFITLEHVRHQLRVLGYGLLPESTFLDRAEELIRMLPNNMTEWHRNRRAGPSTHQAQETHMGPIGNRPTGHPVEPAALERAKNSYLYGTGGFEVPIEAAKKRPPRGRSCSPTGGSRCNARAPTCAAAERPSVRSRKATPPSGIPSSACLRRSVSVPKDGAAARQRAERRNAAVGHKRKMGRHADVHKQDVPTGLLARWGLEHLISDAANEEHSSTKKPPRQSRPVARASSANTTTSEHTRGQRRAGGDKLAHAAKPRTAPSVTSGCIPAAEGVSDAASSSAHRPQSHQGLQPAIAVAALAPSTAAKPLIGAAARRQPAPHADPKPQELPTEVAPATPLTIKHSRRALAEVQPTAHASARPPSSAPSSTKSPTYKEPSGEAERKIAEQPKPLLPDHAHEPQQEATAGAGTTAVCGKRVGGLPRRLHDEDRTVRYNETDPVELFQHYNQCWSHKPRIALGHHKKISARRRSPVTEPDVT